MNSKEKNHGGFGSPLAMWGIRQQTCNHGNQMVSSTTMSSASAEALSNELFPRVVEVDADQTIQLDRRSLRELEPEFLLEQAVNLVRANPALSLSSELTLEDMIQKATLLEAVNAGRRPQVDEELTKAIRSVCCEAGRRVRELFDSASGKAPSKVAGVIDDLLDGIDQMDHAGEADGGTLGRFAKRTDQLRNLSRLQGDMRETTFRKLKNRLLENAENEYVEVLHQWAKTRFQRFWKKECETVIERCEKYRQDSRAFDSKVRLCREECHRNHDRAKEHLTTLKAGNQVVLNEASEEEFLAALMASRKVGGQAELIVDLRHEFEQHLRQLAEKRGMGRQNAQRLSFRVLVLTLPVTDVVDAFTSLIMENISDSYSFYESCQAYGLERLVSELARRSRITSWFNGRDDQRFGITQFEVRMVRMPKPANAKEAQIKDLLEALLREEGFHEILSNGQSRSISALRIYAGWPIGIEGGNPVLLDAYNKSASTGHLPHLVGILPDTKAGEHAPSLLNLYSLMESKNGNKNLNSRQ